MTNNTNEREKKLEKVKKKLQTAKQKPESN